MARVFAAMRREFDAELQAEGVTITDWAVLAGLHGGAAGTPSELARLAGIDRAVVTALTRPADRATLLHEPRTERRGSSVVRCSPDTSRQARCGEAPCGQQADQREVPRGLVAEGDLCIPAHAEAHARECWYGALAITSTPEMVVAAVFALGGGAKPLAEQYAESGLPKAAMYLVGALEVAAAIGLFVGPLPAWALGQRSAWRD